MPKLRRRRRSHVVVIEPGVGYAELKPTHDIQVSALFPEDTDVRLLQPSLDKAFQQAALTRSLDTPVWATFFGGKDADGKLDGGESKCWAWHRLYPATKVIPPNSTDGLWEIRARLGELL